MPVWLALLIVAADRLTKIEIQRAFTSFDAREVLPGWLRIVHTENPGAAFGMLAEGNPLLRSVILIGMSTAVLLFVVWALWSRSRTFSPLLTRCALSLILGGALGNLYDRIAHGTVTDFIEVYHGAWSFPAFNVADSAITVGAALLLIDLLRPAHDRLERHVGKRVPREGSTGIR
jgi:signal peptidase II